MRREAITEFVESWGRMGALWGINRSAARIHALLMAAEEPLCLDDIAETLGMSRGNASMSLKELRGWNVVTRITVAGDRRDFYRTEEDVWRMFFNIMSQRKRREFDPALQAIRSALASDADVAGPVIRKRFAQMEELLASMEEAMRRFLSDETTTRAMISFLTGIKLENSAK